TDQLFLNALEPVSFDWYECAGSVDSSEARLRTSHGRRRRPRAGGRPLAARPVEARGGGRSVAEGHRAEPRAAALVQPRSVAVGGVHAALRRGARRARRAIAGGGGAGGRGAPRARHAALRRARPAPQQRGRPARVPRRAIPQRLTYISVTHMLPAYVDRCRAAQGQRRDARPRAARRARPPRLRARQADRAPLGRRARLPCRLALPDALPPGAARPDSRPLGGARRRAPPPLLPPHPRRTPHARGAAAQLEGVFHRAQPGREVPPCVTSGRWCARASGRCRSIPRATPRSSTSSPSTPPIISRSSSPAAC